VTAPHADLVIVRHGESLGNAEGFLAGWRDVDLTERGCEQARTAGRLLRPLAIPFAAVFTSLLRRATRTADLLLRELGTQPPRHERWRLNERHYGALQGLGKDAAKERYGKDLARTRSPTRCTGWATARASPRRSSRPSRRCRSTSAASR
jgi:2,3-bisphosphoglycerate-dependent phosphoglycerate mutase